MMNIRSGIRAICALALLLACGCTNATPDLKSPCVGAEGSPCDRRPANTWQHPDQA